MEYDMSRAEDYAAYMVEQIRSKMESVKHKVMNTLCLGD